MKETSSADNLSEHQILRHSLRSVTLLLLVLFGGLVILSIIDQKTGALQNLVHRLWG